MAASVSTPSPSSITKGIGSSPMFSPTSDKQFWSNLRNRVDTLLESRATENPDLDLKNVGESDPSERLKQDTLMLLRGFDSVKYSLNQLSNNLDNALQGARDLSKQPTLTEILRANLTNSESQKDNEEETKKGLKRKFDPDETSEENSSKEDERGLKDGKLKKAKNLAISMTTKAATMARELKSLRSDLSFMQERCALLEEENKRLRVGFSEGIRPEEDDLVRLQLEALLAEKSRLANENANLTRENQCLHQLVEYHQLTSQDLSDSNEQVIQGLYLDFSSPVSQVAEEGNDDGADCCTPRNKVIELPTIDDSCYEEEDKECKNHCVVPK